jgi:glycerophosphoryl diester phosphodiesterase
MGRAGIGELVWPAIVAHRGASVSHPENTLEAFEAAVAAGADAVELDVRPTRDGVLVVLHDSDVSATTDGVGHVHRMTLDEVKALDASGGAGRAEVPTLHEALTLLSGRAGIDIEIKNLPGDPGFDEGREVAATEIVRLLDELSFDGSVLVSSFSWLSIDRVRELNPSIPTGFLTGAVVDPASALHFVREKGYRFVLPQVDGLTAAGEPFVRECREAGVRVGAWTVDDPGRIAELFGWGVDAVVTNDPAAGVAVRDGFRRGAVQP